MKNRQLSLHFIWICSVLSWAPLQGVSVPAGLWQDAAGSIPPNSGPYVGTASADFLGFLDIGGPPGTEPAVDLFVTAGGPLWTIDVSLDIAEMGFQSGGSVFVFEYLRLSQVPGLAYPLNGWSATIQTPDFVWGGSANLIIWPEGAVDPIQSDPFVLSNGDKTITFLFPEIDLNVGFIELEIAHEMLYTGPALPPGSFALTASLDQSPLRSDTPIPEASSVAWLAAFLFGLLIATKRVRK